MKGNKLAAKSAVRRRFKEMCIDVVNVKMGMGSNGAGKVKGESLDSPTSGGESLGV